MRGAGKLVYKGDPEEIKDAIFYELEFNEEDEVVLTKVKYYFGGDSHFSMNKNDTGVTAADYVENELRKSKQQYENSTVTVFWDDSEGTLYEETFDLDIQSELHL